MTTAQFLTSAWPVNLWVIAASVGALILYSVRQRGRFSGRAGWWLAGVLLFYLTLASPIDTLADGYLFSAHMLQHLLLLLIVPALILLGLPEEPASTSCIPKWLMILGRSASSGLHLARIFGTYRIPHGGTNLLYRLPLSGTNRQAFAVANTTRLPLRAGKETRDTADLEVCGTSLGGSLARHGDSHILHLKLLARCSPGGTALPNGLQPENAHSSGRRPGENGMPRGALVAWLLGLGGMWLWHAPTLCNAAVASVWVHRLQYVSLLGMGFTFWWPIIGQRLRQRLSPLAGMMYLFSACLGCTILGIIITFAPVEVCSIYLHPVDRLGILPRLQNQWGLTPANDQQLGGLLMWVPACLVYFTGILGLFARWHREVDQPAGAASLPLTTTTVKGTHAC